MHIRRDIEPAIIAQLSSSEDQFLLLSGARQTGKTAILEQIAAGRPTLLLNLWDETREIQALRSAATLEQFTQYLSAFYQFTPGTGTLLIIDEAQGSPHLGKFLMQMHRTWKGQRVIFSGSLLSHLFTENVPMPTGRVVEFTLRPLNFREFLRFRDKEGHLSLLPPSGAGISPELHALLLEEYQTYLMIGGMPGIVNTQRAGGNYQILFESLVNNYYRDADRYLANEQTPRAVAVQYGSLLEHCLKSIGRQVAFPTTNSSILSTDSPAYRTLLPRLLDALRSWHLIYVLEYENRQNTSKRGYSSKKYLFDTGIMNFLLTRGMPVPVATGDQTAAQLLENAVCQELVAFAGSTRAVTCYRSHNKLATELDFVVRTGSSLIPVEVKSGTHITTRSLVQLFDFMRNHAVRRGFVVYGGMPRVQTVDDHELWFLPPYYLHAAEDLR